jgi:hypothetical protein
MAYRGLLPDMLDVDCIVRLSRSIGELIHPAELTEELAIGRVSTYISKATQLINQVPRFEPINQPIPSKGFKRSNK